MSSTRRRTATRTHTQWKPWTRRLRLERLEDRSVPSSTGVIALGADTGGPPVVNVTDPANGQVLYTVQAYDPSFTGGVRVAVGDVNGDGVPDLVTAAGPGGGPHVKVFDGQTHELLAQFMAYDPAFRGGVNVALGDVNNDGRPDIVTGAGVGGGPHVKAFDLAGNLEESFFAYDPAFRGGVNVAVGDVNGDQHPDIVTGTGVGGGPHVKAFSGTDAAQLASFMAYDPSFRGGVFVAAGDTDGDGTAEIITGAGTGGGPHVEVFGGQGGAPKASFLAYDASFRGGVRVAAVDADGDNIADIATGAGPGGGPHCVVFSGATLRPIASAVVFNPNFTGGLCVAGDAPQPIAAEHADVVLQWDTVALNAIRVDKTPPPKASRALAIMSAAVYDAVNAVVPLHEFYHANSTLTLRPNASMTAAAASAAHDTLASLFPAQKATFDTALAASLAAVPDGAAQDEGVQLGQEVAQDILTWRSTDGSATTVPYTPGTAPGQWRPTPPANAAALLPQWPSVTPFAMTSGSQFRPAGPPTLTSAQYAADLNQVESLGRVDSTTRTADQTQIALFWADGASTFTPPGHWNQIAQDASLKLGLSLAENARLFALLNIAEADAGIVSWDAKFTYNFWRPITAIQNADQDGNAATTADPTWTPLIATPPFPTYTSGHSTFSGAAAAVLTAVVGDVPFTDHGDPLQQYTRSFTSFNQAADEAGMSRIYGGIHYMTDNLDGLASGRQLGSYVVQNFMK